MKVSGTHCNYVWIVSRSPDGGITLRTQRVVLAGVPSGYHHDDAGIPGCFHGLAQRIERIALVDRASHRQVQDPDVVGALEHDCLLNCSNHRAISSRTVPIERAEIYDRCLRRDSTVYTRVTFLL